MNKLKRFTENYKNTIRNSKENRLLDILHELKHSVLLISPFFAN